MTPNVHQQQQRVPIPKELIERLTEEQTSVNKPTLGEIEDAVNYLISLHNQKQKKRNNSFWTKCISCFGLQRKPLKAKHIDQILSSLKRGVIPMELTLIVSIQRWEKELIEKRCYSNGADFDCFDSKMGEEADGNRKFKKSTILFSSSLCTETRTRYH